jgi:hypothetical protein
MLIPAMASAQVELGLDFFGITYSDVDGASDAEIGVSLPLSGMRVAFAAGENMMIETRTEIDWSKQGDATNREITLMPGLNYMVNEQVYVRGEAGLNNFSFDPGTGTSFSGTQYMFGGAVGMRRAFGMGVLRLEAGAVKALENTDDGIPAWLDITAGVGVSVVVN